MRSGRRWSERTAMLGSLRALTAAVLLTGAGYAAAQAPAASQTAASNAATVKTGTGKTGTAKPAAAKAAAGAGTPAAKQATATAHKPTRAAGRPPSYARRRVTAAQTILAPAPVAVEPVAPPVAEKPKWPAFDPAAAASVVWDSRGLSIKATNSSLQAILKEVSTETGTKVEGMSSDQRVFGVYGPGQARDVLSQLLQGSGYNVIMVGDLGAGAPRQVLLSMRQSGSGAAQPNVRPNPANNEDDAEPEEQPEQPERPQGLQPRNPLPFSQERPGPPFGNPNQQPNPPN